MDNYSLNRPRRDGWLSWPCWLTDSGRFTHKVVTRPAVSLAQDREIRRPGQAVVLIPLCYANCTYGVSSSRFHCCTGIGPKHVRNDRSALNNKHLPGSNNNNNNIIIIITIISYRNCCNFSIRFSRPSTEIFDPEMILRTSSRIVSMYLNSDSNAPGAPPVFISLPFFSRIVVSSANIHEKNQQFYQQ